MALNVCMIVDSNLRHLVVEPGMHRDQKPPFIRCPGQVYCPYVIDVTSPSWPTVDQLASYTDIVIALGINHCKLREEFQWKKSANDLVKVFDDLIQLLPQVRLYCVEVPPSLSQNISRKSAAFNASVASKISESVCVVKIPQVLFDEHGLLKSQYARKTELRHNFPDAKKLHLDESGVGILTYWITSAIRHRSGKRIR